MANRVLIFDTTLRDGEQSPGCSMTVPEKLRMARKLVELGVDILEAGFPIASDGDYEAVRAIAREFPGVRVAALARACTLDVERAARALEPATRPRIHTFIATSDIHLRYKLRKTREQVLEEAARAVELSRRYVEDVEFSAEDATRTDPDYLIEVCRAAVAAGASTINLPDTVGYSLPEEFGELVGRVACALGDSAIISVHCHNDLGLATANSLAGLRAGARQIECTINGIGERAGNCALEEVVMAMKVRHDLLPFETGIVTEQLYPASRLLASLISFGPQPNKAIVGDNAFAHEAGIHQDGFLKERTTYEIMDPRTVGVPESKLVLGKHSGRHALSKRCQDLGYALTREQLEEVYQRFIAFADRKKGVRNEEIVAIIEQVIARPAQAAD
ncbi:MAG: 2-isopropylmalate synthase [Bryobacterales bacterium]|nr:2-isopropylmalate synthase [Bryobacteraceae bacterium]MDW8131351.1 2-isopropylmalate synthase [Bryobacterales bacterium]